MNYRDDPEIAMALAEAAARRGIWRAVLTWWPLFLAALGGAVFFTYDQLKGGDSGSWFLVGVLSFFSLLLGYQAAQSLRDLLSAPHELTGMVTRRWSRTDSLVVRSHYVRVEGKIFRLDRVLHREFAVGDYVWIRYFPHSAAVVAVEKRPPPEQPDGTAGIRPEMGPN